MTGILRRRRRRNSRSGPLIYIIAGEESGDQLGANLIRALNQQSRQQIRFVGIGGPAMTETGIKSLFPMSDIAVMGFSAVLARIFKLRRRIGQAVKSVLTCQPDCLLIIDSPGFTHRVARQVVKKLPDLPVINYVSPSVWAWRSGRAAKMAHYVDQVLAILPFEPDSHIELGGPPCTYVGHPLLERHSTPDARNDTKQASKNKAAKTLLVMPGSRISEISRLLEPFAGAVDQIAQQIDGLEIVIPVVEHLSEWIKTETADWRVSCKYVETDADKAQAFAQADAALVASGTATLELALARVPMVVAYKIDFIARFLVPIFKAIPGLVRAKYFSLPNIILDKKVVSELLNQEVTPSRLAEALLPLFNDHALRSSQLQAFDDIHAVMRLDHGEAPSEKAARTIIKLLYPSVGDEEEKTLSARR